MSPNQRFLAALAVGVVLYVLPSTLEMERRSHGLRGASRASHIEDGMHFPTHDDAAGAGSVPLSASPLPAASGLQAAPIPGPNKLAAGSATVVLRKNHMELVHAGAKQQHQQEAPRPPPQRDEQQQQQQQQHEGEQEQARPQAQGSGPPAGDATAQDGTESSSDTAPIEQREVEFDDGDDAAGETSREGASQESGVAPEGGSAAAGAPAEPGVAAGGSGKQPTGVEGDAHRPHRAAHQPRGAGQGADHGAGHRSHSHSGGGGHTGRGVTPADMGPDGLGALPGSPTCGECSHHGICQYGPAGSFQSCECAVLYAGAPDCSKVTEFAKPAPMASFQGRYDKALILSKSSVRGRAELKTIRDPTAKTKALRQMITVGSRLTRALPEHDPTDRRVYRTCAIVGSSGILLKYHRGEEIDKHDMVFRFNSAPTRGFEKFCGRKTTHRITNSRNFAYREFPTEIDMQHMRSPNNIESLITQRRKHPKTRFFGIHPDFINYMDDSLDFLATSGLFGIMIAMHKCAQIDIYGFQVHSRHGVQYHYYNPKDLPANEGRDDTEFQVIKALAEAGFFRFAEPCILECHESADVCSQCKAASGGWQ
eukprot:jgi/Tetstr1/450089/TSEL_037135.t1